MWHAICVAEPLDAGKSPTRSLGHAGVCILTNKRKGREGRHGEATDTGAQRQLEVEIGTRFAGMAVSLYMTTRLPVPFVPQIKTPGGMFHCG